MPHSTPPTSVVGRPSRREFLTLSTGLLAAAGTTTSALDAAVGRAEIRIGLVGCGGRGTGAVLQAAAADPGVRIVAIGDAFADQLASSAHVLAREAREQFVCPVTARFSGGDAHRRVLDADVDAVVIAAPPHLRPLHAEAAVAAGVHVFCETPAAIDVHGALRVARAFAAARAAGLSIASGLHARRDECLAAVIEEVRAGAIGRPCSVDVDATYGTPSRVPARQGGTEAEDRLRNWTRCDALSGGHFVERHVHALDRALWVLGDRVPAVAEPVPCRGGDAVAIRYHFADGTEIRASSALATDGGASREAVSGSRAVRELHLAADGRRFQATMDAFLRGIRSASGMDDSGVLIRGSLVAIMGRLAAAADRPIGWAEMLAAAGPDAPACQIGTDVHFGGV